MGEGELKKLTIKAYTDEKYNSPVEGGEFTTLVNPEKYVVVYKPEYEEQQGQGTSTKQPNFLRIAPQELDFELLFDSTGVIDGKPNKKDGIIDQIDTFKKIVFDCLYMHELYPKIFSRCCINKSNVVANEKGWNVETKDFNCKGNKTA